MRRWRRPRGRNRHGGYHRAFPAPRTWRTRVARALPYADLAELERHRGRSAKSDRRSRHALVLASMSARCDECDEQAFAGTDHVGKRQRVMASALLSPRIAAQRRNMDELHKGAALGRLFQG